METMKVAVLTPFRDEPADWLEVAAASVRTQVRPPNIAEIRHLMIFDGPESELPNWRAETEQVICVGRRSNNVGQTPRLMGAQYAVDQWDSDILFFLDADDAFEPTHVARLVLAASASNAGLIMAPTFRCTIELERYPAQGANYILGPSKRHLGGAQIYISTSSSALNRPAFAVLPSLELPTDRLHTQHDWFFSWLCASRGVRLGWTSFPTYRYRIRRPGFYQDHGLPVPKDAQREKTSRELEDLRVWNAMPLEEKDRHIASIGITDGLGTVSYQSVKSAIGARVNDTVVATYDRSAGLKIQPFSK
jgi:hypothetical protein